MQWLPNGSKLTDNTAYSHRPWFGALLYLTFGVLWIGGSDYLLGVIVSDPELYSQYQTYKGWLYVGFTAVLAWLLLSQRQSAAQQSARVRQLYEQTFALANVGIAHVSLSGQWLRTNERMQQILGYSQLELQRMTFQQITHPEDLNRDLTQLEQLKTGVRREYSMEKRYRHKEGHYLWCRLGVRKVENPAFGEPFYISIIEDIDGLKLIESELRATNLKFQALLDSEAAISIQGYEADGTTIYWNKASERIYGFSSAEAIGKNLLELIIPASMADDVKTAIQQMVTTGRPIPSAELVLQRKDGSLVTVFSSHALVQLPDKPPQMYCIDIDLTEQKKHEQQVAYLGQFDALTDLPNRTSFLCQLRQAIERAERHRQLIAVIILDVDHFKNINDSYGHSVGDELLQQVSAKLSAVLRPTDLLSRLGGDEFAVQAEGIEEPEDAARIADKMLQCIHRVWTLSNGMEVKLSASAGISLFPLHELSAEALLQGADAALYKAKSEGRNISAYYTDGLTQSARERLMLESRLRTAILEQQLVLFYQPQVQLATGQVVGAEALIRWQDPDEGLIGPDRFIPIAESTGLIHEIGLWVIQQSCRQGVLWQQLGLGDLRITVNVSAHQFQREGLTQHIADTLLSTGFNASLLELEMTESALLTQHADAVSLLQQLKQLGIRLAIDDFGTGYSSLAYLKALPLDVLKVDKSFIDNLPQHQQDAEICKAIVRLAHTLGFEVIAEGVEHQRQHDFLNHIGCDVFQGYWFAKPLPADEFASLVLLNRQQTNGVND
ncbi:EAL domain-containing protein [Alkalimonas sp. MEB108]|uniref:EAL domain-containing protein n=1 Tax=Alkalimonas cellulosilytica TaxID=3058395 RepID=A0ABU7J677_9GAMM|nr:EAL domain-containing protein [Alkalimonas sp. MEB108]MEE2002006.1 EAL domain-containing protein [Alkalimonas sp. MEB108]